MPVARRALFAVACLMVLSGGCSEIAVRSVRPPDLLQEWRASLVTSSQLSPRTLQTLRRYGLEQLYHQSPDDAAARLQCEALTDPQAELLFALAEMSYRRGLTTEARSSCEAIGHYYLTAGYAYHYLFSTCESDSGDSNKQLTPRDAFDPRFRLACELYNAGLAKCLRAAQRSGRLDPRQQLELPSHEGVSFKLSIVHEGFAWQPNEFGPLRLCSDYEVVGLANQYRTYGLGVPLIGTRIAPPGAPDHDYLPAELNFPVTAFIRFDGTLADLGARRTGKLELVNPLRIQTVVDRSRAIPLETDITTPQAFFLAHSDLPELQYIGFLRPAKLQGKTGIHMLQPYEPGKIPVVLIHGLLSSPLTWAPVYNDLMADPKLRDRFQFWAYFYPTGDPYLATAADLRQRLQQLRADLDPHGKDAALEQMVFVGHSMGGLISHLMTVDSGDDFWNRVSDKPFKSLHLHEDTRRELQTIFYFEKQPSVKRVVFIGTPHHGSKLSPSLVGRAASKLVAVPKTLMALARDIQEENPDVPEILIAGHIPTSVDLLAPGSPALELLAARPKPDHIHFHSIIGLLPDCNSGIGTLLGGLGVPKEGDGVVPYSSAHLPNVDSEVVVQADHLHVHHHPLAIRELRRILLEHLQASETIKLVSGQENSGR